MDAACPVTPPRWLWDQLVAELRRLAMAGDAAARAELARLLEGGG